jgi:hypothetical protein
MCVCVCVCVCVYAWMWLNYVHMWRLRMFTSCSYHVLGVILCIASSHTLMIMLDLCTDVRAHAHTHTHTEPNSAWYTHRSHTHTRAHAHTRTHAHTHTPHTKYVTTSAACCLRKFLSTFCAVLLRIQGEAALVASITNAGCDLDRCVWSWALADVGLVLNLGELGASLLSLAVAGLVACKEWSERARPGRTTCTCMPLEPSPIWMVVAILGSRAVISFWVESSNLQLYASVPDKIFQHQQPSPHSCACRCKLF